MKKHVLIGSRKKGAVAAFFFAMSVVLSLAILAPLVASAQVISPGDLIEGHAEWDRIDTCISCHQLGKKSIDTARCLSCHTPLRDRIEMDLGLHATYDEPNCASCHKDHFGRDFDAIRFDTLAFDHNLTGYELLQSHTEVACTSCHDAGNISDTAVTGFLTQHRSTASTYLGLDETCETCHESDNVHSTQFDQVSCSSCHDQNEWDEAPAFDHAQSDYPLTGEHITVECAQCHTSSSIDPKLVIYTPVSFTECSNCHEDEHKGLFGPTCTTCHATNGWNKMASSTFEDTFDHNNTEFPLIGLHQSATCASCHSPSYSGLGISIEFMRSTLSKSYPHPFAGECQNCHDDAHAGSITTEATCISCHNESGWAPADFDVFRHEDETKFPLEGAHLAVECSQCHTTMPGGSSAATQSSTTYGDITFGIVDQTCEGCHTDDNIHGDQFAPDTCDSCHSTSSWLEAEVAFDHSTTDFPLVGAHLTTACLSCHVSDSKHPEPNEIAPFRNLAAACISCHAPDNPHGTQFDDVTCDSCHDSSSFLMASFDHNTTNWPLEGAHISVSCASCHTSRPNAQGVMEVQYQGIGTACQDCHSDSSKLGGLNDD